MNSDTPDGLFDESLVERMISDPTVIEAGAGIHKRFKPFDEGAVMMVAPSLISGCQRVTCPGLSRRSWMVNWICPGFMPDKPRRKGPRRRTCA